MARKRGHEWTNQSVIGLFGQADPIGSVTQLARQVVLDAIENRWNGPPYDPFQLAHLLKIPVTPRNDVLDARTVPIGSQAVRIEFNPSRPRGRMRFSIAHEIAHTLFPDCAETARHRASVSELPSDEWQLELLCNVAAAEFLMPVGTATDLRTEPVDIKNVLRLRNRYDVSTEAILLRMAKLTSEPCAVFAAAREPGSEAPDPYRLDYSVSSPAMPYALPSGIRIRNTVMSRCTAVGYTDEGIERWSPSIPDLYVECAGVPSYPGERFPPVVGVVRPADGVLETSAQLKHLWGDATKPRGDGYRLIAHVVNDRSPTWGAGFARAVRNKWGAVQDEFRSWIAADSERLRLGVTHQAPVTADIGIVHMIAQHGYGESSGPRIRYSALKQCLTQLASIALEHSASVHMPLIGTGQAGGNWNIIRELIGDTLIGRGVEVTAYQLPTHAPPEELQGVLFSSRI